MTMSTEKPVSRLSALSGRKKVTISTSDIVACGYLNSSSRFPLLMEPKMPGSDLAGWIRGQEELVREQLRSHGAILFRGFDIDSSVVFRACAAALSPELLNYTERAAPRKEVDSRVYTSTEYPAAECIPLHHEMSYSHMWPLKIWFYCDQPAAGGGCTPIADDRKIFGLIDQRIRDQFLEKQVMYVRNFGEGVDLPWRDVFQTDDRSVVEKYCESTGIEFEWRSHGRLRTRQIRQAVVKHPETRDVVWFNHAHMFHASNLNPDVRRALCSEFRDDELPRNAFLGDGSPIPDEVLEHIRSTYSNASVRFPWQKGDVLLVDNILVSHGRDAFSGERRTLVAMAEMHTNPDVAVSPSLNGIALG